MWVGGCLCMVWALHHNAAPFHHFYMSRKHRIFCLKSKNHFISATPHLANDGTLIKTDELVPLQTSHSSPSAPGWCSNSIDFYSRNIQSVNPNCTYTFLYNLAWGAVMADDLNAIINQPNLIYLNLR